MFSVISRAARNLKSEIAACTAIFRFFTPLRYVQNDRIDMRCVQNDGINMRCVQSDRVSMRCGHIERMSILLRGEGARYGVSMGWWRRRGS